jgi:hypothetical protein
MHETTIIEIGGEKVEVDADLAPLILELNRLGLKTRNSCQGGGKRKKPRAYISIQLDGDTCFEFNPKYNSLTIRWNRPEDKGKFMPVESFLHTKTGIKRISELDLG